MVVAVSQGLNAQRGDTVVGTWKLVSASATTADGKTNDAPYGPEPTVALTYTREGRMSLIVSYSGRRLLSGADRIAAPPAERAAAFATSFAYAGRYSLSGDTVVHHVEIATVQNWVGTELRRIVRIEGNRLTLRTPPLSVAGVVQTSELVWQRIE